MDDEKILSRGGTERDIKEYALKNGADLSEQLFYIWSWEHSAWWAWNHNGYAYNRNNAGEYTYEEAVKICLGANFPVFEHDKTGKMMPYEAMIPVKR